MAVLIPGPQFDYCTAAILKDSLIFMKVILFLNFSDAAKNRLVNSV